MCFEALNSFRQKLFFIVYNSNNKWTEKQKEAGPMMLACLASFVVATSCGVGFAAAGLAR